MQVSRYYCLHYMLMYICTCVCVCALELVCMYVYVEAKESNIKWCFVSLLNNSLSPLNLLTND